MTVALFIDDRHVRSVDGVRRVFHRLEKHQDNPIHEFSEPWSARCASTGAGYEIDPGTGDFVLWYETGPAQPESVVERRFLCQARSRDGRHWETPPLGLYPFRGQRDTNICVVNYPISGTYPGPHEMDTSCILRDPLDPDPDARYKMTIYRCNRDHDPETGKRLYSVKDTAFPTGLYTSTSPDGVHWPARERLVYTHADGFGDTNTWMLDTLRHGYRLFGKRLHRDRERDKWIRLRHTCWSTDFASWSPFVPILPVDDHDQAGDQVYMNHGFVYGDMYVGFVRMYHEGGEGSLDVDLAYSRDGEEWHRPPEARAILPRGEGASWDSGMIGVFPSPPIRVGDRLYIYYEATADYHSPAPARDLAPEARRPRGLCLATMRYDGFAGLQAKGQGEARIVTRPLFIGKPDLRLNIDAGHGTCRVGLLDEAGQPISGYTAADMDPIRQDAVDHHLRWREHGSVSDHYGRWLSLDIRLQEAELFAVRNGGPYRLPLE